MPRYSYTCKQCGKTFDELHTSFGAADRAEVAGIGCHGCGSTKTSRDRGVASMVGGGFRRYGLWTYDGKGNQ